MKTASKGWLVMLAAGILSFAFNAMAVQPNPQCVQNAKNELEFCKNVCKEDFLAHKDLCLNVEHSCANACRVGHSACVEQPLENLEACKDTCNDAFETARQSCLKQFTEGTAERHQCIDHAQVLAFQCRDHCHEGVAEALSRCGKTLRGCMNACPPAPK